MVNYELRMINYEIKQKSILLVSLFFFVFSFFSYAQVKTSIDTTSIKIGQEITYKIEVEADTSSVVVFPEGQTFMPLEVLESYKIDTTKRDAKYNLIKKYGLTQFDSGRYVIPKQKIIIGNKTIVTDSLLVEVNNVIIDTTKQGLYDIKPIIGVKKGIGSWWKYLLLTLLLFALIGFILWWFIWRPKPLTEEEEIALLPPYDRAKLALKKLDENNYLQKEELKEFYSDLTFIIRKYLDEKVYDRALESTTHELISRLNLLKEGNQIGLKSQDISKIESILQRADLVKFAKSAPDIELARMDRNTIDLEIDQVKESLPEPTEEEKLLDKAYKEEEERKKKRKKVWLTSSIALLALLITAGGVIYKYGYTNVVDTVTGDASKRLLEKEWVHSDYGFPPITISTPEVLERESASAVNDTVNKIKSALFSYGEFSDDISISIRTVTYPKNPSAQNKESIDVQQVAEASIKALESKGGKDIIVLKDKFETPNGAEGLKIYGTLISSIVDSDKFRKCNFTILQFSAENILQEITIVATASDNYLSQITERILNTIELQTKDAKNEEE